MKTKLTLSIACSSLAIGMPAAIAHHSFAAEFDAEQTIELTGYVTKVDWTNPHTYFYIDVETEDRDMSFSVSLGGGRVEYSGSALGIFAQPSNLLRRNHWRMGGNDAVAVF